MGVVQGEENITISRGFRPMLFSMGVVLYHYFKGVFICFRPMLFSMGVVLMETYWFTIFSFRPMLFSMGVVPQSNQNLTIHIMHSDQRKNFSHLELIILYHIILNLSITFQQFIHTGDTAQ